MSESKTEIKTPDNMIDMLRELWLTYDREIGLERRVEVLERRLEIWQREALRSHRGWVDCAMELSKVRQGLIV